MLKKHCERTTNRTQDLPIGWIWRAVFLTTAAHGLPCCSQQRFPQNSITISNFQRFNPGNPFNTRLRNDHKIYLLT